MHTFRGVVVAAVAGVTMLSTVLVLGVSAGAGPTPRSVAGETITIAGITTQWPILDPATDSQAGSDVDMLNQIYGQLFEQGPKSTLVPDLATKYSFSNHNKTVTIDIRKGAKFSDGTSYNAAAVVASMKRDLTPSNGCLCLANFTDVTSVDQSGPYSVQLQLSTPFAPIMQAFLGDSMNWTVSPTALQNAGLVSFGQNPVGAGPFKVSSNSASASLDLVKNPLYWQKGEPKLAGIDYISVGTSESAYAALQSGSVQVVEGSLDPGVVTEAQQANTLLTAPGTAAIFAQVNTKVAPLNNILAREALYYATNSKLLLQSVGMGYGVVTESPSGPGSPFFEKTVPGYRGYDLSKAQALVKEVPGGITVNIITTGAVPLVWCEALANEWVAAGINASATLISRQQLVADYGNGNWTIAAQDAGSAEPALGVGGLIDRFSSYGQFSGVANPAIDGLINQSVQLVATAPRTKLYDEIYKLISDNAYSPFIAAQPASIVVASTLRKAVHPTSGAGGLEVAWETVK